MVPGAPAMLYTDLTEDLCNAVTNSRCGSQGKIDDAKRDTQTAAGFLRNQLTHTGHLESRLLDGLHRGLQNSFREPQKVPVLQHQDR